MPHLFVAAAGGGGESGSSESGSESDSGEEISSPLSRMASIVRLVTPVTASVLIWYGTTGFLEAFLGDPSLAALAPILD